MKRILLSVALLFIAGVSCAQQYPRFGPADGILVGDSDTPQTTAADSSDVISLWTGTCNATTFLRADGSCQVAGGGLGTVTSVGLTVPSGLSVTGSPITTSGTLGITTALNGLLRGTGSGFATATNSNVISLWTGTCDSTTYLRGDGSCNTPGGGGGGGTVTSVDLTMPTGFTVSGNPVTSSGTLAVSTSLSGVLRGTGSGFAAATSSNILSLWTGACSASTFLRGDGSCQPVGTASLTADQTFSGTNTFSAPMVFSGLSTSGVGIRRSNDTDALLLMGGSANNITNGPVIGLYGASHATLPNRVSIATNGTVEVNGQNVRDAGLFTSGTLPVARGGTGTTTSTGSGSVVLSGSPTFTGTIQGGTFSGTFSGSGSGVTNLNAANISSGTLPVARGGTGTTTSTGTGSVVLSNSPTMTGTLTVPNIAASNITANGQLVCTSNGTNCPSLSGPRHAYGLIGTDGSSCNVAGAGFASSGLSGCTRTGVGAYNVSFSPTFAAAPICTMSGNALNGASVRFNTSGGAVVSVVTTTGAGTPTDASGFTLICVGP